MNYRVDGSVAQSARMTLGEGEALWATKGSIISYSSGLTWELRVPGGLGGALKRSLSGEGISLTYLRCTAKTADVTLGANAPGHIEAWDLDADGPVLTTRGAFLAAWGPSLDISVSVARRAGAALFGGAGLVLQRIAGSGTVLVHGRGDFRKVVLAAGEEVRISTGNLAAFSSTLDYDVESVGSIRKTLFSKEGFFMTRLRGPGAVFLQTLKPQRSSGPRRR